MQVKGDGQIQLAFPGRNERQVRCPDGICVLDIKFSVQQVGADREQVIAVGGSDESAWSLRPQATSAHQAGDPLPGHPLTLGTKISLEARRSIASLAGQVKLTDALLQQRILDMVIGQGPSLPAVIRTRGDFQDPAQRFERIFGAPQLDEHVSQRVVSLAKKAAAFFNISRSWRRISFSLRSRLSSCCSAVKAGRP